MTTASATSKPSPSTGVKPAGDSFLARVADPTTIVMLSVLTISVVLLFVRWFLVQHEHSASSGDWSHAYLVPLISLYLLWQGRSGLMKVRIEAFWPGLVPVAMGIWCYVYFIVGVPNHFGQGLALVLTVFGLVLLLTGPAAMRHLFWPVAYLGFGITIPEMVMNLVTYPLQDMAATGGFIVLRMIGVSCDISGNVIYVDMPSGPPHPLNVAEQCSGMRMVIAFLALGVAVALVGTRTWWKRVVLVAMAIPVAVGLNVIRVAVLGLASMRNADLSQGDAHTLIGTVLLIPGFFIYLGVLVALHKAVPEPDEPKETTKDAQPAAAAFKGGA